MLQHKKRMAADDKEDECLYYHKSVCLFVSPPLDSLPSLEEKKNLPQLELLVRNSVRQIH